MENKADTNRIVKSDEEWRKILNPEQFRVLREKGTERAFTGKYYNAHEQGVYVCAACGYELFSSEKKFESGTGWPSFFDVVNKSHIAEKQDGTLGMRRVEINCGRCGGHLGHVFDDGPNPTGLRYCVNSISLELKKKK